MASAPELNVSEAIHASALDLLGRREHSRRELARKLRRRGFPREGIESVLGRLQGAGLVSDERYARLFVRDKLAVNPQGKRRILRGLRAKGVEAQLAEDAVQDVYEETGSSDRHAAESLARKRLKALVGLEPAVARRRLAGYLARRGFDGRIVAEVLREVLRTPAAVHEPEAPAT
ncbi:MAG: regulatory protein RecX [Gemmatimonadota bacterium]